MLAAALRLPHEVFALTSDNALSALLHCSLQIYLGRELRGFIPVSQQELSHDAVIIVPESGRWVISSREPKNRTICE